MGGRSDYEERRKRRIESYKQKSAKAMKEAEALLIGEDAAVAPLYQQGNTYLINSKVSGIETHSVGVPFIYKNVKISE